MTEHPPGWHPDPVGRHEHRYWDGTQWTDHVADQGEMSISPLNAPPPEETKPVGPSMVNLPAISAEQLQVSAQPEAAAQPVAAAAQASQPVAADPAAAYTAEPAASSAPPGAAAAEPTAALEPTERPASPAVGLSVVAPGTGHLYAGVRPQIGYGLIAATVVAIILAWFISWPAGLILYVLAAGFALFDLRPLVSHVAQNRIAGLSDIPSRMAWQIVAAGGGAMVLGLLLPWYRISASVEVLGRSDSITDSANGFQAFNGLDILLLLVGVAAIVLGAINLTQGTPGRAQLPPALPMVLGVAGAIAWLLIVYRLIASPVDGDLGSALSGTGADFSFKVGRGIGALLDYAGAFTVMFGSFAALARSRAS